MLEWESCPIQTEIIAGNEVGLLNPTPVHLCPRVARRPIMGRSEVIVGKYNRNQYKQWYQNWHSENIFTAEWSKG